MKISIVYDSLTGNTEMLAEEIRKACKYNDVISYGDTTQDISNADVIFIGSSTINKECTENIKEFLKRIDNKKIFLFGTCGFDSGKEYYDEIFTNTRKYINSSNEIIGYFYCLGKMTIETREKHLKELRNTKDLKSINKFVNIYNEALKHPNEDDLFAIDEVLRRI